MSVYRRMLGRELPCRIADLIDPRSIPSAMRGTIDAAISHEALALHDRSAAELDGLLANTPSAMLYSASALAHEKAGRSRIAIARYSRAIKISPGELFARHRLVALALADGRLAQAAL